MKTFARSPLRPGRWIALAIFALALPLQAAPPPALTINENRQTRVVEARGRDVIVNGNRNVLTLRGECHQLTVNGNGNQIVLETVATIQVPGNGNQVAWSKAAAGGGEKPLVNDLGNGNTVTRRAD